jgi:PAT family beta-lactamase induction signal transducer AmpG
MKMLKALFQKKMFVTLLMGLSSGMPLLLTSKTLQAWMTMEQVDLKSIGLFALAGLPYTFKFLWAPVFDRFVPPFGRRRGWILIAQVLLAVSLAVLAFMQPKDNLVLIAAICVAIAFFSSSQDIVVDALRRETLKDNELGLGSTFYIYGYRIAMWISGALALILATYMEWRYIYLIMAFVMAFCALFTLFAEEPKVEASLPKSFKEAALGPLIEFFSRPGSWTVLAFILLYKVGDTLAGAMATPFYLKIGYTPLEIGLVAKTAALAYIMTGGLIGGLLIYRYGIVRCLLAFGLLQALSTAGFAILAKAAAMSGAAPSLWFLGGVIALEDISGGMGTAAFVAYMASQTDKRFTATQYALLTSLMGVPRVILSAQTGFLAEFLGVLPTATYIDQANGWTNYFIFCTVVAVPGIVMLLKMKDAPTPAKT